MPGTTIFRRLNKPAEDYLSKADRAVVDVDSTESSQTDIMSIDRDHDISNSSSSSTLITKDCNDNNNNNTTATTHKIVVPALMDLEEVNEARTTNISPLSSSSSSPKLVPNGNEDKKQGMATASAMTAEDRSSSFLTISTDTVVCSTPITPEISDVWGDNNQKPNDNDERRITKEEVTEPVAGDNKVNEDVRNSQRNQRTTSKELRGRTFSLDHYRKREDTKSSDSGFESTDYTPHSQTETEVKRRNSNYQSSSSNQHQRNRGVGSRRNNRQSVNNDTDNLQNDDESSSDDDSSYFATNLPKPKSGRSFSISSNASNASAPCARTNSYQLQKQESDASLSFSDESDDDDHHEHNHNNKVNYVSGAPNVSEDIHLSPVVHPNRSVVDMNLYPQRITRLHSVSSLVSSTSSDIVTSDASDEVDGDKSTPSSPVGRRRSFTGDDSMTSSLPSVASGSDSINGKIDAPADGGVYYVPGGTPIIPHHQQQQHEYMLTSSGGMIPHYYSQQQQSMTNQQTMAWAAPTPSDTSSYNQEQQQYYKRQQFLPVQQQDGYAQQKNYGKGNNMGSLNCNNSEQTLTSTGSIPFVYSDDDDIIPFTSSDALVLSLGNQQADGSRATGGVPRSGNNRGGTGLGPRKETESGPDSGYFGQDGSPVADIDTKVAMSSGTTELAPTAANSGGGRRTFKVYWQRWLMLFYMSLLNLLSDWTCYSVAPISLLTEEVFGNIDPERLVVVFLGANALGTACEPILLARLGLRRTVLFGALLLMIGSIVKSGGLPPITPLSVEKGQSEWSLYLGFFIVGLSQPLYQCTPALLSASWFPEEERTMATGVALNSNQLGIGFAFIFGTLLVSKADDIPSYFGLLSQISTLVFIGTLIQFDDAPPTPPSSSAKSMKGDLNEKISEFANTESVRNFKQFASSENLQKLFSGTPNDSEKDQRSDSSSPTNDKLVKDKRSSKGKKSSRSSSGGKRGGSTRKRTPKSKFQTANTEMGLSAPSSAHYGSTEDAMRHIKNMKADMNSLVPCAHAPSPAMGSGRPGDSENDDSDSPTNREDANTGFGRGGMVPQGGFPPGMVPQGGFPPGMIPQGDLPPGMVSQGGFLPGMVPQGDIPPGMVPQGGFRPGMVPQGDIPPGMVPQGGFRPGMVPQGDIPPGMVPQGDIPPGMVPQGGLPSYGYGYPPPPQYQIPYWDPRMQEQMQQQQAYYQQQMYYQQQQMQQQPQIGQGIRPQTPYFPPPQMMMPYSYQNSASPLLDFDEQYGHYDIDVDQDGAEPTVTVTDHHLDIHIRDDQVIRSLHACMIRPGFSHALAAFTVSGIVINTLSTYMDYLVRLNGAPRTYTGIVGGSFQFLIMVSSLIMGRQTDKTRAYYSVTIGMLVFGAFGLAECGVSLDSGRGGDLRWSLLLVAVLVGPLQPISTELGVEVAYPLSENTVLVIQQLFSNLLSAIFIPFFKSLKDVGTKSGDEDGDGDIVERPDYTFSFYLLIVIHTLVTVYFATFNGKYLRYEHELQKKAENERLDAEENAEAADETAQEGLVTSFHAESRPLKDNML